MPPRCAQQVIRPDRRLWDCCYLFDKIRELEAAIGIEPMNKGFAEWEDEFC
jgi:hypothetical protein